MTMISVVLPAFNEKDAITETVATLRRILDEAGERDAEIIVVDDGSTDETGLRAEKAGARVLRNIQNVGYGFSLKRGIAEARYDTIVIADADGTYPLHEIPALVALHREGYDMVVGARTGEIYRESFIKNPLRLLLKWLVEFTTGRHIPDANSGLRVFSRSQIMPLFPHLSDTFSFTTSSTLAYMLKHRSVRYLPIDYTKRIGKTKVRLLRDSLRTMQYIVQAILYYNPLKLFIVICLGVFLFGVAAIAAGVFLQMPSGLLLGGVAFIAMIVIFALGLLGELICQLFRGNLNDLPGGNRL